MKAKRNPTMQELRKVALLCANEDTVAIGGMAVSILAEVYGADTGEPCMTLDADFFGDRLAIELSEKQLAGYDLRKYLATLDDSATPNSGKLAVDIDRDAEPAEVDFLFRVDGLSSDEIESKAIRVEIDGKPIRVMHPILLLENKINNLALFPNKRNGAGVNQARLAIAIARSYLDRIDDQRSLLAAIERIGRFSQREASCFAFKAFGLDTLTAIASERVTSPEFATKRWPQLQQAVGQRRAAFSQLWERMALKADPKQSRFRI